MIRPLTSALAAILLLTRSTASLAEPASHAPSDASAAAQKSDVVIVLEADDPHAMLERRPVTLERTWEQTCLMPCEVAVDPKYAYRIAGDGLVPSDTFLLPSGKDAVKIDAKMGSSRARMGGILLVGAGALGMLVGAGGLVASPALERDQSGSAGFRSAVRDGGYVALGAGAIAVAAGLYLWLTNATTVKNDYGYEAVAVRLPLRLPLPALSLTPGGVVF
jgi:hypothetical protein